MRIYAAAFILTLLPACSQFETRAATISDKLLEQSEWQLCKAISVGSWVRAYGNLPDKAAAWKTLCTDAPAQTPAK